MTSPLKYILLPLLLLQLLVNGCTSRKTDSASQDAGRYQPFPGPAATVSKGSLPIATGYVNDYENIFSDEEEQVLDSLVKGFDNRTTIQIVIISIPESMIKAEQIESFTLRLLNAWCVGRNGINNGILIGICRDLRKMRIENGYGIERILSNAETGAIIDTAFTPEFRKANYYQGTRQGLQTLMTTLVRKILTYPEFKNPK